MFRNILAVVLGIVTAVIVVFAVEALGHAIYPPPANLDFADKEVMRAYIAGLPLAALLFVMAAWIAATFAGGMLACYIARQQPLVYAGIVGAMVLLGTVINLLSIPHPLWFAIVSVAAIVITIWATARLGSMFVAQASDQRQ